MSKPSLTAQIADLPAVVREAITAIHITLDPTVRAGLSISLYNVTTGLEAGQQLPPCRLGPDGGLQITVDTDALPSGVAMSATVRHADINLMLDPLADIEDQIRGLWDSGLCGTLDAVRRAPSGDEAPRWTVKTWAGGETERTAFLRRVDVLTHGSDTEKALVEAGSLIRLAAWRRDTAILTADTVAEKKNRTRIAELLGGNRQTVYNVLARHTDSERVK